MKIVASSILTEPSLARATLFAKSKNVMLSHLFADAIEEEGAGAKGGGGKKKGGGSMQTISATHRVKHLAEGLVKRSMSIIEIEDRIILSYEILETSLFSTVMCQMRSKGLVSGATEQTDE